MFVPLAKFIEKRVGKYLQKQEKKKGFPKKRALKKKEKPDY